MKYIFQVVELINILQELTVKKHQNDGVVKCST